ncbi:MAG: S8 family serine peptidase, partial [Planctomycetes bacterium]|nr:S8 family serine peptidase [Planctomycetota bacterium]
MALRAWGGPDNRFVADALWEHPSRDTRPAPSDGTITILAQQLDATGGVVSERMVSVRRIYDQDSDPGPVGQRGQGRSQTSIHPEVLPAHLPVVLYDNTLDEFAWYNPEPLRHVEDFGLSPGGQVTSFNFGYVTADFLPVSLSIRFYSGTDSQTCPGTFLGGWIFSGLDGSLFGWPEQIAYAFEIPLGEEFFLPAGAMGYSYEFANYNTGVWLTRGGNGNEDTLWFNCQLGSFSSAWAGTYMKIFGFSEIEGTCLAPPAFDSILSPLENWQMTEPVSLSSNACRIYQLNLNTTAGYDFSLCFGDGVGSFSFGDGDLEMFDATGTSLWYIDGASSCDWAASTLGTILQEWRPTASGIYYLKVSEFFDNNLIFNLVYKATVLADPNIHVVPATLELFCSTGFNTTTSDAVQNESIIISDFLNTMVISDKLIWADQIFNQFSDPSEVARVIVHLKEPANLRENLDWNSKSSRESFRQSIDRQQLEILKRLNQSEVNVRIRFKNICAFSAEVSSAGLDELLNDPLVIGIEPVIEVKAHLRQGIALVNALTGRQSYSGAGMAIAIVDTGIDYNHPMLGGGGFPNSKVIGGFDFGDDDADPMAGLSHGTNVAGIAAGDPGDVGDYIGGVAPGAKLYALKITAGFGGSADTDGIVAAWDWCVTHQYADPNNPILVMNTSFGGNQFFSSCDSALPSMTLAASNAVAAGITVLASSGNEGWCDSLAWPACISNVISVGAVYDAAFGTNSWC